MQSMANLAVHIVKKMSVHCWCTERHAACNKGKFKVHAFILGLAGSHCGQLSRV